MPLTRKHPNVIQKVAAIQYRAIHADKPSNIKALARLITEAAAHGARIIVLPEMCTTGLTIENAMEAELLAEPLPGPSTSSFSRLAADHEVYLVLGLAEHDRSTNKFYNSQILLDPTGQLIGKYRKINLFGPDLNWAEKGDLGYQTVDVEWGKIGLGICCDINYPEFINFFTEAHVRIATFSTNWVGDESPFLYWSEMVATGGFYLVAANNWGNQGAIVFSGGSIILSPDLAVLAESAPFADTILYADINN
jgi:predicted amidohydrolase